MSKHKQLSPIASTLITLAVFLVIFVVLIYVNGLIQSTGGHQ